MAFRFDIHLHTSRYSADSRMDPTRLVDDAVRAGLDGVVITEHHAVWPENELREIVDHPDHPGFVVLSGFEYTSSHGDVLIYGLSPKQAKKFKPGRPPEVAIALARELGGACVAAHPTRQGLGFDERIGALDLDAIEVASRNLKPHEQRLAISLAKSIGARTTASSDAHRNEHIGAYATNFEHPIRTMVDLIAQLREGSFAPAPSVDAGAAAHV